MDWLTEPFDLAFQQRALLGGALAAIALSTVGTWVVIRGMTFFGDAMIHGVIPGIALAVLLDFHVVIGAAIAAAVMIGGIGLVHRQTVFPEDTGIGLLFVGMLGIGVILVSRTDSFAGNVTEILFGDILGVDSGDLWLLTTVAGIVIAASLAFYRHFLVLSFDETKARLLGLRPGSTHVLLLALVTLAIVGSFQTVGTLLVLGLLIGPPATATLLVRRVPMIIFVAALIGILSVVAGMIISFHADTAGSATIAVVPVALFFVVLTVRTTLPALRGAEGLPTGG